MIANIEKYNEKLYDKLYVQSRKFSELIHDPGIESYIKSIMSNGISGRIGKDEFKSKVHKWLIHNTHNKQEWRSSANVLNGESSQFSCIDVIHSPFDAINEAFFRYGSTKRLRYLRGEFSLMMLEEDMYFSLDRIKNNDGKFVGWKDRDSRGGTEHKMCLDSDTGKYFDLDRDDWVLISLPFYPAGDRILLYDGILNQASLIGVPVVVDCSLFSYSENIDFNFSHPAITEIIFNLSIGLGFPDNTLGVRYSNYFSGILHDSWIDNHFLQQTLLLASAVMDEFPSDHFVKKCSKHRYDICEDFGFTPTNVVNLCLASYEDNFWFDDDSIPYPTVNISKALTKKLEGAYNVG